MNDTERELFMLRKRMDLLEEYTREVAEIALLKMHAPSGAAFLPWYRTPTSKRYRLARYIDRRLVRYRKYNRIRGKLLALFVR